MGEFGPWHLLIVAAVFVLLFGAKRLPDAARSLGRSFRILQSELHADDSNAEPTALRMDGIDPDQPVDQASPDRAPSGPPAPGVPLSTPPTENSQP